MSMSEKWFLEEIQLSENQINKLLRKWFAEKTIWQHPNWPRWSRRNKLLPSWESMKWKTSKLRNKYRNFWNTKILVASK